MTQFEIKPRPHQIDPSAFVAGTATIIGDVVIGPHASIWFGAVLRGDVVRITIGQQTNIQDNCVLHGDPDVPCRIGDRVTVGHAALVHGATIQDDVLVGMRSVIMNHAVIGRGSVVAAGAIVTEGTVVPPHSVVVGIPARVRAAAGEDHAAMIDRGWRRYVDAAAAYRASA